MCWVTAFVPEMNAGLVSVERLDPLRPVVTGRFRALKSPTFPSFDPTATCKTGGNAPYGLLPDGPFRRMISPELSAKDF
jgi:hypothetical protein